MVQYIANNQQAVYVLQNMYIAVFSIGAVDRGDVTPAPPKTVLTPHVPTPQSDDLPQTNTATTEMHSLCM